MQKIKMEEMLSDLTYESNRDGNVLILFIIPISIFFPIFFFVCVKDQKLFKFV